MFKHPERKIPSIASCMYMYTAGTIGCATGSTISYMKTTIVTVITVNSRSCRRIIGYMHLGKLSFID